MQRVGIWVRAALAVLTATVVSGTEPAAAKPCNTSPCLVPGDHSLTLQSGEATRTFEMHIPASYDGRKAVPFVIDLHGLLATTADQRGLSGQLAESDRRGFIVAWPQGLSNSWNGYNCCGDSRTNNVDDVAFLRAVVAAVKERANINADRVYATGLSNGGNMAFRLGCEAADVFKAIASVSQMLNQPERCHPSRPRSVYAYHGLLDYLAPYAGNPAFGFQSADQSFASWATINGCSGTPEHVAVTALSGADIFRTCAEDTEVGLITLTTAAHIAYNNQEGFNIAKHMWDTVFSR